MLPVRFETKLCVKKSVDYVDVMKAYEGAEVQLDTVLTSALDGGEWFTLRLVCFAPGERTWHPISRRLVGPRR